MRLVHFTNSAAALRFLTSAPVGPVPPEVLAPLAGPLCADGPGPSAGTAPALGPVSVLGPAPPAG